MKPFCYYLISLVIIFSSCKQAENTNHDPNLDSNWKIHQKKIKSIRHKSFDVKETSEGLVIEKVTDPMENLLFPIIYTEIEQENKLNYLLEFNRDSTEIKKTIFDQTDQIEGLEIKNVNNDQNDIISRFDRNGNLIRKVIVVNNKFPVGKFIKNNGLVEIEINREKLETNTYVDRYHKIDPVFGEKQKPFKSVELSFDNSGNMIREKSIYYTDIKDDVSNYSYKYNSNNQLVGTSKFTSQNQEFDKTLIHYNQQNEISSIRMLDNEGNLDIYSTTFTYKFNENGDWTQRIKFNNGVAVSLEERNIEYF